MRFVFVTLGYHPHPIGGAWRYAAELAQRLAARNHRVTVITSNPANNLAAREELNGVEVLRFPNATGNFFLSWRRENAVARALLDRTLITETGPVLLGLHHAFLAPSVASRPEPRLTFFHGPWSEEYLTGRKGRPRAPARRMFEHLVASRLRSTERASLRKAGRILVLSRHMEQTLRRIHGAPLPEVSVVPGGVNLRQFTPAPWRDELRERSGLPFWARILFVSPRRLDPRMGLDVLLRAYARAAPLVKSHTSQLWLIGDGPDAARLAALITELKLEKQAKLLGRLTDEQLVDVLRAADCAVIPSLDLEGFGLATAEALACGTPVLGSNSGATPELLMGLDSRLLFQSGSVEALSAKLSAVLSGDFQLPTREACRGYAERRFSWDQTVDACEQIARDLCLKGGQA